MFIFKLKILLLIIIICCSISIYAQEPLADVIRVQLVGLSCQSSFEEIDAILSDYSQYRLQLAVWSGLRNSNVCCRTAFVLFDPHIIIGEDLIHILNQDDRVWSANYIGITRPRQLQILLEEDTNLNEFLNSYQEFGLKTGQLYVPDTPSPIPIIPQYVIYPAFHFNDMAICAGDLVNLLRSDPRVISAHLSWIWRHGQCIVLFHEEPDESLFQEYDFISFAYNSSMVRSGSFNFDRYSEFDVIELLNRDVRVNYACFVFNPSWSPLDWPYTQCPPQVGPPPVGNIEIDIPTMESSIISVYPNPFNPTSTIVFDMMKNENVKLQIYNIRGQHVRTLIDEIRDIGNHTVVWNGTDNNNRHLSSGIYFLKFETSSTIETKKILLMK